MRSVFSIGILPLIDRREPSQGPVAILSNARLSQAGVRDHQSESCANLKNSIISIDCGARSENYGRQ
jgi:hypothetical protein